MYSNITYTCMTRTLLTTVLGENLYRIGYNVAAGAQCDILLNCTTKIPLLTD